MPKKYTIKLTVQYAPLHPERIGAYNHALKLLAKMLKRPKAEIKPEENHAVSIPARSAS